ncbi:unnamed protein product [Nezara viridula]|uniref:Uncharacterized protein n=1 Tax=Nezara viridula TaxID=85310 RepID=A0A9P0HEA9_NEZVI|nr:unnamed protein product [Nezara viridula]
MHRRLEKNGKTARAVWNVQCTLVGEEIARKICAIVAAPGTVNVVTRMLDEELTFTHLYREVRQRWRRLVKAATLGRHLWCKAMNEEQGFLSKRFAV